MHICTTPAVSYRNTATEALLPHLRRSDTIDRKSHAAYLRYPNRPRQMAPCLMAPCQMTPCQMTPRKMTPAQLVPRRSAVSVHAAVGLLEVCAFVGGVNATTLGTLAGLLIGNAALDNDFKTGTNMAPDNLRKMFQAPLMGAIASPALLVGTAFWAQSVLPEHDHLGWAALLGVLCSGLPIA